jgi:hypothetical protein
MRAQSREIYRSQRELLPGLSRMVMDPLRCRSISNGICERFHRTVLNEFYRVAFRKKVYRSV